MPHDLMLNHPMYPIKSYNFGQPWVVSGHICHVQLWDGKGLAQPRKGISLYTYQFSWGN